MIERKYNAITTVSFPLIAFSSTSYHASVTSTMFAAGDVQISKDYGDFSAPTNLPAGVVGGKMGVFIFTAAELQAKHLDIQIIDQTSPKIWEDQMLQIETFGNTTGSQFAFDRSVNTVQASLTAAQTGVTIETVDNLGGSATTQINAEVVDVIRTDTPAELAAVPAASPNLHSMIQFIYMDRRNDNEVTGAKRDIKNDAGSTIGSAAIADDGTTFNQGKLA